MSRDYKTQPPPQYSFEETMEIADAMERLWATMEKLEEKEVLHPNKTKWEARSSSLKINTNSSKKWNQRDC